MSNSSDSVNSWPGFLAQLNKTFLLIRDILGYALPGAVFLAIGIISKRFSLDEIQNLLHPFQPPALATFILFVGTCYIAGKIMASIAYSPIAIWKWMQAHYSRIATALAVWSSWFQSHSNRIADLLHDNPTEVTSDLLEIRERHAGFFVELDRRETLLLLSGATAAALLAGWAVFYRLRLQPSTLFLSAGVILVIQFLTGPSHLRRVRDAIRKATKIADDVAPTIASVFPPSCKAGNVIVLRIVGTNLRSAKAIHLNHDSLPSMDAIDITTQPSMVHCSVTVPNGARGEWNVVVETNDGKTEKRGGFSTS